MQQFAKWLEVTPLSLIIQNLLWVIPTVQTVHILAIAVVISSVGMIVLRIFGRSDSDSPLSYSAKRFVPWIWAALGVLVLSGSIMVIGEPVRSLPNPAFQLKMGMLLVAIGMTIVFQTAVGRMVTDVTPVKLHWRLRFVAFATLCLWLAIIIAGRWIAYMVLPEY